MPNPESPNTIQFWFEFASTYSYPAAFEIEERARSAGVRLTWRPFLLGPIFKAQGWDDSPFNIYPAKGRYMWRDLERVCAARGLPWRRPSLFPQNSVLAARVALVALAEGWGPAFVRRVYRANFAEDRNIADKAVIADLICELSQDADATMSAATAEEAKSALRSNTDEALSRGIFGAPSFTVGDELFWGHDRMEQALAWATNAQS